MKELADQGRFWYLLDLFLPKLNQFLSEVQIVRDFCWSKESSYDAEIVVRGNYVDQPCRPARVVLYIQTVLGKLFAWKIDNQFVNLPYLLELKAE